MKGRQKNYLPYPDSTKGVQRGTARKKQNLLTFMKSAMQMMEHKLWFHLYCNCSSVTIANWSSRWKGKKEKDYEFHFKEELAMSASGWPEVHSYLFNGRLLEDGWCYYHITDKCNRPLGGCLPRSPSQSTPNPVSVGGHQHGPGNPSALDRADWSMLNSWLKLPLYCFLPVWGSQRIDIWNWALQIIGHQEDGP